MLPYIVRASASETAIAHPSQGDFVIQFEKIPAHHHEVTMEVVKDGNWDALY